MEKPKPQRSGILEVQPFKIYLKLLLICAAFIALHCADGPGFSKKIVLRYWNGYTGPDGRSMLKMVKRFNKENPNIQIVMQRMDWGTFYNKLFVAGLGNRAPEIFVVHGDAMDRFIRGGLLQPIDKFIHSDHGIDTTDFDKIPWNTVERNGLHYSLPFECYSLGLYYNKKLFEEAGIVDEQGEVLPPKTREEFLSAAKKLTKDTDGDGLIDQWGFVFTFFRSNIYTLMKQWGGEFFSKDNSKAIFNNKENRDALQFSVDLIHKYKVAPPPQNIDSWIGFRQGKVGMVFEGIYMLLDLKRQKNLDFGGAPVPQIGPIPAVWFGYAHFCMTKGLTEEKQIAAWRFMKFMSDNSVDWAEAGKFPVRKSLRNTEKFKSYKIQYEFAKQIPIAIHQPYVPFVFEFSSEYDIALEKVMMGTATPGEALETAVVNVTKVINRWNEMQPK